MLVEQGQEIDEEQLLLLREEHEVANAARDFGRQLRRAGSVLVLAAAMFALIGYYIHRHETADRRRPAADRLDLLASVVAALGLARLLASSPGTPSWCRWPSPR